MTTGFRSRVTACGLAVALALTAGSGARAQDSAGAAPRATTPDTAGRPADPPTSTPAASGSRARPAAPVTSVPFSVGERLGYDVKFGIIHVGSGTMEVAGVDTMRGRDVWHTVFRIKGGTVFYHVDDVLESWFERGTLASLRFDQHLNEGGKKRDRNYVMYPERSVFVLNDKPEQPSVPDPLDDGSFLYFVRSLPLVVGETYTFNRYFNPKANPVIIKVLRRERVQVPAGKFNAIVVQPIIKTSGIFSDRGEAQIWFSDDSAHMVLQMKSKLSFGSLNLYLKSIQPGRGAAASQPLATPSRADTAGVGADTAAGSTPAAPPAPSSRP
jgi:Protein of unknown function (DUF3108)